jgi:hypothetical protein
MIGACNVRNMFNAASIKIAREKNNPSGSLGCMGRTNHIYIYIYIYIYRERERERERENKMTLSGFI